MSNNLVSVKYRNNNGAGFSETANVISGTTVGQFLASKDTADCKILLTRRGEGSWCPLADEVLVDGDAITCSPLNIKGA